MLSGFININKKSGLSSNKVLSILKYRLKQNNIKTKVGHFGTLDPIAEGVLPVALGRATRLFDYSLEKIKVYDAVFEFGVETDTLDNTGTVLSYGRKNVTAEEIKAVIPELVGSIEQVPPSYSAKSVGGVRAYDLARKGKEFVLPPKKVEIYSIELLDKIDDGAFSFRIRCGGGTYIRSIIRDMAAKLGTVGIMSKLTRIQSGNFTIDSAYDVDELDDIENKILPIEFLTDGFNRYDLTEREYSKVKNGVPVECRDKDGFVATYYENDLLGIGEISDGKIHIKTWLL